MCASSLAASPGPNLIPSPVVGKTIPSEKVILPEQVSAASDLKKLLPCIPSTVSLSSPLPGPSLPE